MLDWEDNKILELAKKHMSNNNEEKIQKIVKYAYKLSKKLKENDYIQMRDGAVLGLTLLGVFVNEIDNTKTTQNGREDLLEIKDEIIEAFKLLED